MASEKRHDAPAANPDIESDVPGDVTDFLHRLSAALKARDIEDLNTLYEDEMQQLTDRYYSVPHTGYNHRGPKPPMKHWPLPKFVKQCFGHPQVELLYQLQQFRSQYSDRNVSAAARQRAWATAEKAFDALSSKDAIVDLPEGWVWDIVDEFLYQLQTHRIRRLRPEHAQGFPANCWNVAEASTRLEQVADSTQVRVLLGRIAGGQAPPNEVTKRGDNHLQTMLGYSSIVGLVKLRVLLGDYIGALECAEPLGVRSFGSKISASVVPLHVSLYYHVGFAYLMLHRYADAVATLKNALSVKAGNRKYVEALQIQAAALLAIAGTLGDLPAQDYAATVVSERQRGSDDDAALLAQGDVERYREVFLRACPKFFTAADVSSSTTSTFSETGQEAKDLQLRMFLRGVYQRLDILKLRGYLGAYSTLTNAKVSSLLSKSATPVEAHLVAMKRSARQLVRAPGMKLVDGELKRTSVVDFTADSGSINVQRHDEQPTIAAATFDRIADMAKGSH